MASISGTSGDWAYLTHTFSGAGTHTLEWTYSKDGSASNGSDCGWVDQVDLSGWTFGKVATPTFLPPDGTLFDTTLAVTVSCATAGAEIRYTLDGSEPTAASTLYTAPITLSATTTIRARASKTGRADSDLAQATYSKSIAPPSYLPIPGTVFSEPFAVTIRCSHGPGWNTQLESATTESEATAHHRAGREPRGSGPARRSVSGSPAPAGSASSRRSRRVL
jgi:hypothetical protein